MLEQWYISFILLGFWLSFGVLLVLVVRGLRRHHKEREEAKRRQEEKLVEELKEFLSSQADKSE